MGVALVALLLAAGGTGYAASQLPDNSVGTNQLKKSAVISPKVKDHSLLKGDFKAGQLPAGPRGLRGAAGPPIGKSFLCRANQNSPAPGCGTWYDKNGLRIVAACASNGFTARATVDHAVMTIEGLSPAGPSFDSIQNSKPGFGFILDPSAEAAASGVVTFIAPGRAAAITLIYSAT
jgi:hypothetical protein